MPAGFGVHTRKAERFRDERVLTRDRKLAGLISIGDVVRAVIEHQKFTIDELQHYITGTPRWG